MMCQIIQTKNIYLEKVFFVAFVDSKKQLFCASHSQNKVDFAPRCDVLVASDTKGPFLPPGPDENTLLGTEKAINGITEEKNPGQNDDGVRDDPKKTSEASTSKLEMFQEKQKFIEEQNRKRKEMLSKVKRAP